jgi:hypothetical protein
MNDNEPRTLSEIAAAELELSLQEALARRQRAADLFDALDWDDEDLDDYVDDAD